MFHANESKKGKGTLSVLNGKMTFHVSLAGKSILNLYVGKAENAKNDESAWLVPTKDKVTYEDGYSETVNGFDIPVKKLEREFDLALIGKKGVWYDHKVSVCDVSEIERFPEGEHQVRVILDGGSGRAGIVNPACLKVSEKKSFLKVQWTSSNYDYMIVNGVKYMNQTPGEKSTFTFEIPDMTKPVKVIADTTAMGNPHEIEYTIGLLY